MSRHRLVVVVSVLGLSAPALAQDHRIDQSPPPVQVIVAGFNDISGDNIPRRPDEKPLETDKPAAGQRTPQCMSLCPRVTFRVSFCPWILRSGSSSPHSSTHVLAPRSQLFLTEDGGSPRRRLT
jgi:hypothetical protein